MTDDRNLRIAMAVLNGSNFVDIADLHDITVLEVQSIWNSIASQTPRPPCNYRNMREVLHFRGEWREAIYKWLDRGR